MIYKINKKFPLNGYDNLAESMTKDNRKILYLVF